MSEDGSSLDAMVTGLVPSLSRSLAEQFNVFRVMHHGTHEKQLSNVFAWLLRQDATHGLGDVFQRILLTRVNAALPEDAHLPLSGYRVTQEVDTSREAATGRDIADIVLSSSTASVVIENFGSSDGHGHNYYEYLAHGAGGSRDSVVVLLCIRQENERLTGGWEQATVLTYSALLGDLQAQVQSDKRWREQHPEQDFFISQLVEHFSEGPGAVTMEHHIAFIKSMCETGESVRYGYRPQEAAAEEFAELLAQHAKRQFEDGRRTLSEVKGRLRQYAARHLQEQLNARLRASHIASVQARFVGKWEWYIRLLAEDSSQIAGLVFGPTAAIFNTLLPAPLANPDFSKLFVVLEAQSPTPQLLQTEVGLDEVLSGLGGNDDRLLRSVLDALNENEESKSAGS